MAVQLNIGCGMTPTEAWINYDNSLAVLLARWPFVLRLSAALGFIDRGNVEFAEFCRAKGIRYANAVKRIPHVSSGVDVIYSCHMIEHLDRAEARSFLAECRRVLKPGGVLRIVVPDLRVTVNDYLTKGNADVFADHLQLALDKPRGLGGHLRHFLIGNRDHHWLYDGPSMRNLMWETGFKHAEILKPGETRIISPGKLDLFERAGESAIVEATREG